MQVKSQYKSHIYTLIIKSYAKQRARESSAFYLYNINMISINLKQATKQLMLSNLYDFVREMWDSYETAPLSDSWYLEYLCECFMWSVRHFLPRYVWRHFIDDVHYEGLRQEAGAVCDVRDKRFRGNYVRNHNLNMPPRHSKSSIVNVLGPTWLILNTPVSVASVSHSRDLASEMVDKKRKLLHSDKYAYYFREDMGRRLVKDSAECVTLQNGGKSYSVSQAGFTGFGADCFAEGTKIHSKSGYCNIEDLRVGDEVLSYNHNTGKLEYKKVQAIRKIWKDEHIEIETSSGKRIKSTTDHRYWVVGRGYVPIDRVGQGEMFWTEDCLQNMWEDNNRLQRDLQELYGKDLEIKVKDTLQALWESIISFDRGKSEAIIRRNLDRTILFSNMCMSSEQREQVWCRLWRTLQSLRETSLWESLLFSGVQTYSITEKKGRDSETESKEMPVLSKRVCSELHKQEILQQEVRRQCTFSEYEGERQSEIQDWFRLLQRVQRYETYNFEEGWILLSELWRTFTSNSNQEDRNRRSAYRDDKFSNTPQRQEHSEQRCRKSSNSMSCLPCGSACVERLVRKDYSRGEIAVYDIQVEDNHNFFAEGVLVHNCIIADDLVSVDKMKKDGSVLRDAKQFYRQTLPNRLNSKNIGVIWHVMQRIGKGDITDMIMEEKVDGQFLRDLYSHTEMQAIWDKDMAFIYPCSGKIKEIRKGDLLCPERFGDYVELKIEMGTDDFETQCNQIVKQSKLNVIKEEGIHWIEDEEYEEWRQTREVEYASHDCPVKDKETSDYHGFCSAEGKGSELVITDGWEEHLAYVKEKELLVNLQVVNPGLLQIVEDKANGSALLQDLRESVAGLVDFQPGTKSKLQRAELAYVYMSQGLVRFRRTKNNEELVKKLLKFPFLDHDDEVDAFTQLVIYHFTQRRLGVYTGAFSYQNVVPVQNKALYLNYAASMSGAEIKVLGVQTDLTNDTFTAVEEHRFDSITQFEEFCRSRKGGETIYDASVDNRLYGLVNNVYNLIKFSDRDRDKAITILKSGFYKKKVLVSRECKQTVLDISRMRITEGSREAGQDKTETLSEGFAGCLRAIVIQTKGYSTVWF